ncbi:MAG: DEAD/DEAH box helicase family protein [Deltaproteobacteria bacterium]|nr:DEAD/DEAH box helicase family protein [Deltaproteobacteria bacterium]
MSERQTRQEIIDKRLADAGWNVSDPTQVTAEHPILHQSSSSTGTGYADYLLIGQDGKPLAVVEAKKTSADAEKGREQAKQYADGLEQMEFPRPFIFYTNGHEIHFWDDTRYGPRKVWGFFNRDDLERLAFQRKEHQKLSSSLIDTNIVDRPYQLEAIRRVLEAFSKNRRKALLVMATGTGKTRVAMALIDVLMRANWVKRVLFLADRNALLRQADGDFKSYLPNAPRTRMTKSNTPANKRVYLATYPAMHGIYPEISPGFFDLIIADESHRSIYNRYKEIFDHFDACQIGLTATPVEYVDRNTFRMFECENGMPIFNFSYEEAVNHSPPYLVPFKALHIQSRFQIEGIKGNQLPSAIQKKLIEEGKDVEEIDFDGTDLEKKVSNSGTNELIVREFMEQCTKDETGTKPGKSIIFAISHKHALHLEAFFNQLYPEYKGRLARVIDSHDPRANTEGGLLDQFKDPKDAMKVAISVDMLDTGVDVREVVNLVFAKPVFSRAKFWQMIGRGTRLREDLFGPGKHKEFFLIIDHWNNFKFFNMKPEGKEPVPTLSIPERLFLARLEKAKATLETNNREILDDTITALREDIKSLPEKSVLIKEKASLFAQVKENNYWVGFDAETITQLERDIRPLMKLRSDEDFEALKFDINVIELQRAWLLSNAEAVQRLQDKIVDKVKNLPLTLNQVRAKEELLQKIKSGNFWKALPYEKTEEMRMALRGIMKHRARRTEEQEKLDLEDITIVKEFLEFGPELERASVAQYRKMVEEKIRQLVQDNEVLQRLKNGEELDEYDIQKLADILRAEEPYVTEELLRRVYDNREAAFIDFIRHMLGLEKLKTRTEAVTQAFDTFIAKHNDLTGNQIQFLQVLRTFILERGKLQKPDLIHRPFTNLHPQGIRGLFTPSQVNEIIGFVKEIGEWAA